MHAAPETQRQETGSPLSGVAGNPVSHRGGREATRCGTVDPLGNKKGGHRAAPAHSSCNVGPGKAGPYQLPNLRSLIASKSCTPPPTRFVV